MINAKVVIIGAGSAGLSALRQVKQQTNDYLIIDQTPLGTKCARMGCMPSKALISIANDVYRAKELSKTEMVDKIFPEPNISRVLENVREKRDYFSGNMASITKELAGDKLITGRASFVLNDCVEVNGIKITAEKFIIAVGARPKIPPAWHGISDRIYTSDILFEQKDLPKNIAVIGLGAIGLEIGQALSRLGINVTAFTNKPSIALSKQSEINDLALKYFTSEFPVYTDINADLEKEGKHLIIKKDDSKMYFDAAVVAIGLQANTDSLGLENMGLTYDEINYSTSTMQIDDLPVFIAGDANGDIPILHEALDEGYIAGKNAIAKSIQCYERRVPVKIVFSDPQFASVGKNIKELQDSKDKYNVSIVNLENEPRAILSRNNKGLIYLYSYPDTGTIAGAELFFPHAEHLVHQIAWAVQNQVKIVDILKMAFYHPTYEEAFKTALIDASEQITGMGESHPPLCNF